MRCAALAALLILGPASGQAQPPVQQVLLLQSLDRGNMIMDHFTGNLRVELDRRAGRPVNVLQVVVGPTGFVGASEQAILDFIRSAYADRPRPDLIVSLGGPASVFARKYRGQLFPDSPLLLGAVDQRYLREAPVGANETAVAVDNDFPGLVDDILQLLPETKQVFMVMGSGLIGRFWHQRLNEQFLRFRGRLTFVWSDELSLPEILSRCGTLPENSAIFYFTFGTDAAGAAYADERVLADLQATANAPLFALHSVYLGSGVVGGRLLSIDDLARHTADVALRLLNGVSPNSVRLPPQLPGQAIFDWRELQRWGIPESRLPSDSVVRYREPSVWQEYRGIILTAAGALAVQALLIIGLLFERGARQRAEIESRSNLALAAEVASSEAKSRELMEDAVLARQASEQAYLALHASEERYRSLFDSIDEGFCVIEMLFDSGDNPVDYRFLETNPAFEKQCGLHDAIGKCMRELAPQNEAHWFETYGHVALTGEPTRFTGEAHAVGRRWFDVYALRLGASELRRVAILFTDITERRSLEEKTQEQARSLADLNRRKDEFLAMLSHELRNPLGAILNAAHVLRLERDRSPIQVEARAVIERQGAQLARLVDDLLDVSRISTGRVRLQMDRVDMCAVVRRAVEAGQLQTDQKGQTLTESLPEEPLYVQGDAVRLEQVVMNLLHNAHKYTDRGGQILVTLQEQSDEALFRVRDNGVGIAPELLPHIFSLFTQANQSLDRAQGGLGIGLALVQSLVTMQGGRVEVRSTLGEGSEFLVRLPVLSSPHESAVVAEVSPVAPAPAHALRVLVVEDNVDVAKSIARLLRVAGHDTRVVNDGMSAISVAREFVPNVVLLDIGLPIVDGFQVAKSIRQEPALGNVLLVALTGYGRPSDIQRTAEAGFDCHLVKPANFAKIESILAIAAQSA